MMKRNLQTVLCLLLLVMPCMALSAEDGQEADTSDGSIRVSLSILPSIRIDTVTDINLRIVNRDIDTTFAEYLCITGNFGGKYTITAHASNESPDNFSLSSEEGQELPYFVAYRGNPQQNAYDELRPGIPSPTYDLINEESCNDQNSFKITFKSEDLGRVDSGLYTGNLTLLVSPV